jgi:hypothetical protein
LGALAIVHDFVHRSTRWNTAAAAAAMERESIQRLHDSIESIFTTGGLVKLAAGLTATREQHMHRAHVGVATGTPESYLNELTRYYTAYANSCVVTGATRYSLDLRFATSTNTSTGAMDHTQMVLYVGWPTAAAELASRSVLSVIPRAEYSALPAIDNTYTTHESDTSSEEEEESE